MVTFFVTGKPQQHYHCCEISSVRSETVSVNAYTCLPASGLLPEGRLLAAVNYQPIPATSRDMYRTNLVSQHTILGDVA